MRDTADGAVEAGTHDWAQAGNDDPLPAGKLVNSTGLTQEQTDERVALGTADWAQEYNTDPNPYLQAGQC